MFFEQRLANIESQLAGILELLRESRGTPPPMVQALTAVSPPPEPGQPPAVPDHKQPDLGAERARIKNALMALRRAGGDPSAVLAKAGVTLFSEISTLELVAKIDALIDDDQ